MHALAQMPIRAKNMYASGNTVAPIYIYTVWKYQTYDKKLKCQFTYRYNDKNYGCLLIMANIGCSYC